MEASQLTGSMRDIRVLVEELHTPWRANHDPRSMTSKAPTGQPGAPLKAAALDLGTDVHNALHNLATGALTALQGNPTIIPRDTLQLIDWLRDNADVLAPHIDDSDAMDLAIVADRLRRHHGYATDAQKRAIRLAETRGKLGTTDSTTATAEEVAGLMRLRGTPVSASTIRRWGRLGYIGMTTYATAAPAEFNVDDVRQMVDESTPRAA